MKRTAKFTALFLLAPLALTACSLFDNTSSSSTQPVTLFPDPSFPIADLPVPEGFHMVDPSHSDVTPGTNLRFVNHNYDGRADYLTVVRFYRDTLPAKGWTFLSQQQANDTVTLNFTKNNEDCVVTVRPGTLHSHINIRLYPTARISGTH